MAKVFRSGTLELIENLFSRGTCTGLSDTQLLDRFVADRDVAAFGALVTRHGSLVLSTCRGVLKDPDSAEDAFQATFVLLFRKAASIRGRDAVGAWLHRVAYRVALQARASAARRLAVEKHAAHVRDATAPDHDLGAVLHEEIERLPDRFRLPVVLCYLDGMTRDQAAAYLRWTEGTVRGRLAQGRELLRDRLSRRGVTLAVPIAPAAAIAESLVATTVRAATAGPSAAVKALIAAAPFGWASLRLKVAAAVAIAVGAAGVLAAWHDSESPPPVAAGVPPKAHAKPQEAQATMAVEGRVVDLEGRPVVGARFRVTDFEAPDDGNLDAWIDELKRFGKKQDSNRPLPAVAPGEPERSAPVAATTGPDGRFRIEGLAREGLATVSIDGPGLETSTLYVMTREMSPIRAQEPRVFDHRTSVYYGARFEYVVARARAIVGTVRDKDTGRPIAGVRITGLENDPHNKVPMPGVGATSDAQGRYRLEGLPTSRGFKLFTEAPAGQPYVHGAFVAPAPTPALEPLAFDITLKRGLLVRGRLTDKVTGEGLRANVNYYAFEDNPYLKDYPHFSGKSPDTYIVIPRPDGRFTIPAVPGRGLIAVHEGNDYLFGIGADAIAGLDPKMRGFYTVPSYCISIGCNLITEINPAPGTEEITLELQVDPGRTVQGTIVDTSGQPIRDAVQIHRRDGDVVLQGTRRGPARFTVTGLLSGPDRLDFIDAPGKRAGALFLTGTEAGDLTVTLQSWGAVVGRIVDEEGKPRTNVEIYGTIQERLGAERGSPRGRFAVDARGRFRIEGLVPGVKYDAYGHSASKAFGMVLKGVRVGPGEVKDIGDVTLPTWKPPEER